MKRTLIQLFCVLSFAALASAQSRNVAVLVYEGVELLDFAGPGEVFAATHGFQVYTVAESKEPVSSMGFLTVMPQYSIDDCPKADIIVVPGGSVPASHVRLQQWIAKHRETGEITMSVCNGAALLAAAGVLEGLEVTTHHNTFGSVIGFEPSVKAFVNRRFVDHGSLITTAGISAGIDGSLHVVARLAGQDVAQRTATYMEYDWRPEEIAELHATPGIRFRDQSRLMLASIAEHGLETAVAKYSEGRAIQSETDRTLPGERRLRAMAHAVLSSDDVEEAIQLFEFTKTAYPASAAARDGLEQALETARLMASGKEVGFVYSCPPCGGACDAGKFERGGNCPHCGMILNRRAVPRASDALADDDVRREAALGADED